MKTINRIFLLLAITSLAVSCAIINQSQYSKLNDEFTGKKTISVTQYLNPIDSKSNVGSVKVIFQRIQKENKEDLLAYFVINRYTSTFDLENKAFLKANGEVFELSINRKNTEYKTSTSISTTNLTTNDSTKVSHISTDETTTKNWYEEKFSIPLNIDMASSIIKGNEVIFRFYFGPEVGTYMLTEWQIGDIKRMFEDKL